VQRQPLCHRSDWLVITPAGKTSAERAAYGRLFISCWKDLGLLTKRVLQSERCVEATAHESKLIAHRSLLAADAAFALVSSSVHFLSTTAFV
jgi:hypothetical protein